MRIVEGSYLRVPAAYRAAAFLAAGFGAAVGGIDLTDHSQATASWWPAGGLGVLTLLTLPRRWWPGLAVALALVYGAANYVEGRPAQAAVCLALADVAEAVVVAVLVRRVIGRRMHAVADFGWLLAISLGGAVIAGLGVATTSATLLGGDFGRTVAAATSAHWASVMLILPLGMSPAYRVRGHRGVIAAQAVLLAGAGLVAFAADTRVPLGFLPLPLLIWAGVSFGYLVVAVEQIAVGILVTAMTVAGRGPFREASLANSQVAQLYLVSLVIAGLPLALAVGEQRRATAAARAENRRTNAIIDSSTTPIMVTDAEGTMLSVNPATTALSGFTAEDLVGRPFWEKLIAPEEWAYARRRFTEYEHFPEHGVGVIRTAAGGERIVAYSNGVLINPDDTVNYVITANDITTERATTHFLEHLFRSATAIAILGLDRTGAITLVNAGAASILQITPEEASGRNILEFLDPAEVADRYAELEVPAGEPADEIAAVVGLSETEDAPLTRDWWWLAPVGPRRRISMTTSVVDDARGRPIGHLLVARDVTETRRNQELLHQALEREQAAVGHLRALDNAKDDFISTVSHELRTPLTSIIGSTELLTDGMVGELAADQRHLIEVIERNAERLLALANDLLLLAAFENSAPSAPFAPVDLGTVVRASIASIGPLLIHRTLDVRTEVPDEPVVVNGDASYLERAVTNLLTNAVKFTPDGGSITTSMVCDRQGGTVTLRVADTGIGIPSDELADVFGRFYRSRNVHADAIQGTGLGLSIVASIAESHRGTVDVTSRPGAGTTFSIVLPLA